MPNGAILYRGPSLLDGKPIVVVAVGLQSASTNRKTGAMVQTYIIRADMGPIVAVRRGADVSICGNCRHRGNGRGKGRTCYVNLGQGPLSVYRAFRRGRYPVAVDIARIGAGRIVRLGTYGDPAAVPLAVWESLTSGAVAWTGYTHQWRIRPDLQRYCMASVDSELEAREARLSGWRTFRVAMPRDIARMTGEAVCPASAEAGKKLTCTDCRMCHGTARGLRGSIVIQAHGGFAVMANVRKLAA